jgi:NAD(P)H-hydrate repair Nnr-like enzyme with NAD(P)H-hydrate dehydratase domain
VVCSPKLDIYVNETGNSALAKAGTGDILTGMISGLCAQGMKPYNAAILGVYLHGKTGEIASGMLSEYSVLASDLLKYIPLAIIDTIRND